MDYTPACGCDDDSCRRMPEMEFEAPYGIIRVNRDCMDNAGKD